MARRSPLRDFEPVIAAGQRWAEDCLVRDGSLFSDESLWTLNLSTEAYNAFVKNPDTSDNTFLTKLKGQVAFTRGEVKKLVAEMMWVLFLFQIDLKPETKVAQVKEVWEWSADAFSADSWFLSTGVLQGIGRGGQGYNTNRWRELSFLMEFVVKLKSEDASTRSQICRDYDRFVEWIASVPEYNLRQVPQILRFLFFPDLVERIATNTERRKIIRELSGEDAKGWTDRQFDDKLRELRSQFEDKNPGQVVDFYAPPIDALWRGKQKVRPKAEPPITSGSSRVREVPVRVDPVPYSARNLIFYGPPGTGKTFTLRSLFSQYTQRGTEVDPGTWLHQTVAASKWRPVIAAALRDLGTAVRVADLCRHPWMEAKAHQRGLSIDRLSTTTWGYLQEHTPEDQENVRVAQRRFPFVFLKDDLSRWRLVEHWRDEDIASADLYDALSKGPQLSSDETPRYRVVTFHPSYSYEDFVRGIRPVYDAETGQAVFRLVDGVFKQICDEARVNPGKRYAIFIDEINRANIAKVFGELITLIEPDKRAEYDASGKLLQGMEVQLPGGEGDEADDRRFGVPRNLDIYGTMNTADRSIALLDIALRRRFEFREMEPDYSLPEIDRDVDGVHLASLLHRINDRIEFLLDRDHRIGHAYLLEVHSVPDLQDAFADKIIPLLQEYFFDSLERVAKVLETDRNVSAFIRRTVFDPGLLWSGEAPEMMRGDRAKFAVTDRRIWNAETFLGVYANRA